MEIKHVSEYLHPKLEELKKKYFSKHHPDDPIILHRKELVNANYPFQELRDSNVRISFEKDVLDLIETADYKIITVVIDKKEQLKKYKVWQYDPYHYSLMILLERYYLYLSANNIMGDVFAESRGGRDDRRLKKSFRRLYDEGTNKIPEIKSRITSCEIKIKPKSSNIAGLQLADLIAHPSFKSTYCRRNNQPLPDNFGGQIAEILEKTKYRRKPGVGDPLGRIWGWGRIWLP